MDLIKIGKYIAGKRKAIGLTQKQLAEKLNMSDKSVSKWERGVCMPDVSVYLEICEILGISINEFLAGEDIRQEDIIRKSEDNLIQVTTDGRNRQTRLKRVIAVLLIVALVAVAAMGMILYRAHQPENYIAPVARDSAEMRTAELLSGTDGALLYRYKTAESVQRITVKFTEYQSGKLTDQSANFYESSGSLSNGILAIVPDFEKFTVKLVLADEDGKLSTDIPILDGVEGGEWYGRSATQIEDKTNIRYDEEQYIVALIYASNEMHVLDISEFENGNIPSANDYMYVFSITFNK